MLLYRHMHVYVAIMQIINWKEIHNNLDLVASSHTWRHHFFFHLGAVTVWKIKTTLSPIARLVDIMLHNILFQICLNVFHYALNYMPTVILTTIPFCLAVLRVKLGWQAMIDIHIDNITAHTFKSKTCKPITLQSYFSQFMKGKNIF